MKLSVIVTLVALVLSMTAPSARAADNAVIIQGWLPTEASGLDWVPEGQDTLDELWNDCYLAFEMFCARPGIDTSPDRIHMLWGTGSDYFRRGLRYDPQSRLGLWSITDSIADLAHINTCFESLATKMDETDTMFCYTWGHGGINTNHPKTATHFYIAVRPISTKLWDTALARMTDPISSQRVFIMQQCYAGGFIDDLNDDKTTMVLASDAGSKAFSCDNHSKHGSPLPEHETTWTWGDATVWRHCEFNFHIMNAMRGVALWPYDSPSTVVADTNGDDIVSWYEAYRYNDLHNSRFETPAYCDPTAYSWSMASIPQGGSGTLVRRGAALAATMPDSCDSSTTCLWALKGNNTREFWKYDVRSDTWTSRPDMSYLGPKPGAGATLTAGLGGRLYATVGHSSHLFLMYDTLSDTWSVLPDVPGRKLGRGTSATFAIVESVPYVYLLNGNSSFDFNRFNAIADTWEILPRAPDGPDWMKSKEGSCIAFDGDTAVYVLKGYTHEFYSYSTASGTWSTRSSLPFYDSTGHRVRVGSGAGLAACGDWVFAMKGHGSRQVCAYNCLSNSWMQAQDVPSARSGRGVKYGGSLVQAGGLIWILKGNRTDDFYRFAPNRCYDAMPESPSPPEPGPNEFALASDGYAEDVRWSNSGDWVAYTAPDSGGHRQVYKVSSGGDQPLQITGLVGDCARPVWSPGDTSLAFEVTLDDSNFSQIAVVPDTGGQATLLTSSHWDHWHATWSQTGTVGFLRDDSTGFPQVYVKVATGEAAFTQQSVEHESPEFVTPTQIVFTGADGNGYTQVYQTTASAPNATALTSSAVDHANPVVASSAGLVFFEVEGPGGFTQIAKAPVGGGPEIVLTSGSYDFESPTVNDSASLIYCTRSTGPLSAICQASPTGGYVQLTDEDVERVTPHAQPSGQTSMSAAYVRDGDVYRLAAGGGGQQSAGLFSLALDGVEPNPGRARVRIRWQVPVEAQASLRVYNTTGQLVKVLADGRTKPGTYTIVWNGTDTRGRRLAAGIYFCTLDNGTARISRKLVLTE